MSFQTSSPEQVYVQAQAHLTEASRLFAEYAALTGNAAAQPLSTHPPVGMSGVSQAPRYIRPAGSCSSLEKWANWLKDNQPALRADITEATETTLAPNANRHIILWNKEMETWPDEAVPDDIVCRIQALSEGKGRPPMIYFLWSQRFDVRPIFNVGPERRAATPNPMLGVVRPPVAEGVTETMRYPDGEPDFDEATDTVTSDPDRCSDMDEWHGMWDETLEDLAFYDAQPTDDEMDAMVSSLPSNLSDSPKAILAVEYNKARRRAEVKRDRLNEMG